MTFGLGQTSIVLPTTIGKAKRKGAILTTKTGDYGHCLELVTIVEYRI